MTDTVESGQSPRERMGLETVRSIAVVNPFHIALAMVTGGALLYALIAIGLVNVPAGGPEIETLGIAAAGVFLAFAGWFRLIREAE